MRHQQLLIWMNVMLTFIQYWEKRFKKFWAHFQQMTTSLTAAQRVNISNHDLSLILQACDETTGISYHDALRRVFWPVPGDVNNKVAGIPVDRKWWAQDTAREFKQ
jgi:hypothetical protein